MLTGAALFAAPSVLSEMLFVAAYLIYLGMNGAPSRRPVLARRCGHLTLAVLLASVSLKAG
jgi:hypothetical protein